MVVMLVVVAAVFSAIAARYVYKQRRAAANTVAIEAALRVYSEESTGLTRKQVQDYLRSRGANFFERCCFEPRGAFSVLVKVGQEEAPWYCSDWPDYVAFEFNATEPYDPLAKPSSSDVLKMAHLVSNGEGRL